MQVSTAVEMDCMCCGEFQLLFKCVVRFDSYTCECNAPCMASLGQFVKLTSMTLYWSGKSHCVDGINSHESNVCDSDQLCNGDTHTHTHICMMIHVCLVTHTIMKM